MKLAAVVLLVFASAEAALAASPVYCWHKARDPAQALVRRIPPPKGCERVTLASGTFGHWLRHLPLKPGTPPVLLYNGKRKANQEAHAAVVDIDVGARDLQQCADAVIRLRAEHLYSIGKRAAIHFNFTSGDRADFAKWATGYRPIVTGNKVRWARSARGDSSYRSLRRYLTAVFAYAGSYSLSRELKKVADAREMHVGDVFIQGGFPGHAVLVVDLAVHPRTGKKLFLLAQSYMPAQDIHVLKNPTDAALSPWYPLDFGTTLRTPEWTFRAADLKRF